MYMGSHTGQADYAKSYSQIAVYPTQIHNKRIGIKKQARENPCLLFISFGLFFFFAYLLLFLMNTRAAKSPTTANANPASHPLQSSSPDS